MQTKGESPSDFSTSLFEALMRLLLSETQRCVSRKTIPAKSFQLLCMVLSVLEAFTASPESDRLEYRNILRPLSTIHGLFYLSGNYSGVLNQQIQSQLVRVILNVTNSNPAICAEFATRELVGGLVHMVTTNFGDLTEDALGQENNPLNSVILALGALINLTEQSEASRSIFLHSAGSHQSFLDRLLHLFKNCVGSISTVCSSNSPFDQHVELIGSLQARSVLEVHHNVAVGYLAVLLLTLSLDTEIRFKIKKSFAPHGLGTVTSTVDEFLQYHQKIEQEISPLPSQEQPASGFMTRLQELIAEVRLIDR